MLCERVVVDWSVDCTDDSDLLQTRYILRIKDGRFRVRFRSICGTVEIARLEDGRRSMFQM